MENTWINIKNISCNEVSSFKKCDVYIRKNIDICFLIGELVFITSDDVDSEIYLNVPELSMDFARCENTVLALKNDDTRVMLHVSIDKGCILIQGFPFEPRAIYELNLQFFMRMNKV